MRRARSANGTLSLGSVWSRLPRARGQIVPGTQESYTVDSADMPSQALVRLTDRLKDVDQLMIAHRAIAGSARGRKFEVVGINRAAILLLCSHFEGYLEDLMAEALEAVNPKLVPDVLTYGFHNPWPDRIDDLFAFLGMAKPSKNISWRKASNKSVRDNLGDLVRTRNKLAHGTVGVKAYKSEVARFRGYVEGFSERFDSAVRSQVHKLTGSDPWPA